MKHFAAIFTFLSVAIAAPVPGWPDQKSKAVIPQLEVEKIIEAKWPHGTEKNCLFWSGFDTGVPKSTISSMESKIPNSVSWYSFFSDEDRSKWEWGTGDANSGYVVGITSAMFAKRCGEDGGDVYILIPKDRSPDDPYPAGSAKPRKANWNIYEEAFVTMPNKVNKIQRVDPDTMDADIANTGNIFWKKGDGQRGTTTIPVGEDVWN